MSYLLGVSLAVASGLLNNVGSLLQKKVVNDIPQEAREKRFFRTLVRNPLWFTGLVLQLVFGSIFFMAAQLYIGPALIPGLMATGLIVLAVGSVWLIGESLRAQETAGILALMAGIAMLALSGLVIDVPSYDFLDPGFITRIAVFTAGLAILMLVFSVLRHRWSRTAAVSLAVISGLCFAMSNYWIGVLMGTISNVFEGTSVIPELILFGGSSAILVLTNIFGISTLQTAYKTGQVNLLIPIQQVPVQTTPGLVYLLVFLLPPPDLLSVILFFSGVALIIVSSFLLARRQVAIESIK